MSDEAVRVPSGWRRLAWICVHLIAVLVPLGMSHVPFLAAGSLTLDQFALIKVVLLRSLVLVGLVAWLANLLLYGGAVRWPRVGWLAALFLVFAGLSTVFALDRVPAIFGAFGRHEGLVTLLTYFALFFLVLQLADSGARVRSLARTVVLTAAVVATYGLIQAAGWDPLVWPGLEFDPRLAFSTFGNPDLLGGYLVAPLAIALALLFSESDSRWQWTYGGSVILMAGALVTTFTRGAWIGAVAGVVLMGVVILRTGTRLSRKQWAIVAGAILSVVVVAGLSLGADVLERNFGQKLVSTYSVNTRFDIWRAAARAIAARPLLGSGPDTFGLVYTKFEPAALASTGASMHIADNAHNIVLQYAATLGVLGAALFLAFTVAALWVSRTVAFPQRGSRSRLVFAGFWVGSVAYLVYLLAGVTDVGTMWLLWVSLAIVLAPFAQQSEYESGRTWAWLAVAALLVVALVGVVWNASQLMADNGYMDSTLERDAGASVSDMQRAVRLNPLFPPYWTALGSSYGKLLEQAASGAAVVDDARTTLVLGEDAFKRAEALSPHDSEPPTALAEYYNRTSLYLDPALAESGERAALRALELRPNSPKANYQLALSRLLLGDLSSALAAARKAADLAPQFVDARLLIAQILQQQGNLEAAREAYEASLKLLKPGDQRVTAVDQVIASIEASLSAGAK